MTLGLVISTGGCGSLLMVDKLETKHESPLRAARASSDAVTLDIFWANLPAEGPEFDRQLWRFVQEDRIDPERRSALLGNGLRAGVVGGAPPEVIVRLLDPLGRRRHQTDSGEAATPAPDEKESGLGEQTGVRGRTMAVRPGEPVTLLASQVYEEAIVLEADLTGSTFRNAQAVYRLRVDRGDDGAYAVGLTPELHLGSPRAEWVRDETSMIAFQKMEREKRVYDELRVAAPLVVGEMLLVTSLPDCAGQLGPYFHQADQGPTGHRKAILIRLTQAPPDPAFGAPRDPGLGG
ncbi:hypothetical protein [Botrimarina hoheduenensis]|uniref:hypothetical protein n=1 Tax=Botrimarina hoheduenensis TaxID=2528000 RepID=UPI0011B373E6|nr:hypothetical protein [Botrimarina hoheduenensis]